MYVHIFLNEGDIFAITLQRTSSLPEKEHVFSKLLFLCFLRLYKLCCDPFIFWLHFKP